MPLLPATPTSPSSKRTGLVSLSEIRPSDIFQTPLEFHTGITFPETTRRSPLSTWRIVAETPDSEGRSSGEYQVTFAGADSTFPANGSSEVVLEVSIVLAAEVGATGVAGAQATSQITRKRGKNFFIAFCLLRQENLIGGFDFFECAYPTREQLATKYEPYNQLFPSGIK